MEDCIEVLLTTLDTYPQFSLNSLIILVCFSVKLCYVVFYKSPTKWSKAPMTFAQYCICSLNSEHYL